MLSSESGTHAIERREGLSQVEFVERYCRPRRPVILTDAIARWPAATRWTPAYFADRVGDHRVDIDGTSYTVEQMIGMLETSTPEAPAPYLRAQKVVDVFPELAEDVEPPIVHSQPNWAHSRLLLPSMRRARLHEILIGGRGAGFHVLHYDKDHLHAFISQLHGDKDFFVYAPDQAAHLYPKPSTPNQSRVDIFAPDLERHPDFVHARQLTLTLHPGETVFMPPGWWHTTRMSEPSISVTWNCVNATNWDSVMADTRQRVVRRLGGPGGLVFDLYARTAARALRSRDPWATT
jgi:hypothetical protein